MAVVVLYNVDQAFDLLKPLGITKTSLYRAISSGKLKSIKIGKRYVITEIALNEFLQGQE